MPFPEFRGVRPQALRAWEHLPRPTVADIITLANGKTSACQVSVHPDAAAEMVLSFPCHLRYTMRAAGSHGLRPSLAMAYGQVEGWP